MHKQALTAETTTPKPNCNQEKMGGSLNISRMAQPPAAAIMGMDSKKENLSFKIIPQAKLKIEGRKGGKGLPAPKPTEDA